MLKLSSHRRMKTYGAPADWAPPRNLPSLRRRFSEPSFHSLRLDQVSLDVTEENTLDAAGEIMFFSYNGYCKHLMSKISEYFSELISTNGRRGRKVGLGNAVLHTSSSSEAWFGWDGLAPFEGSRPK